MYNVQDILFRNRKFTHLSPLLGFGRSYKITQHSESISSDNATIQQCCRLQSQTTFATFLWYRALRWRLWSPGWWCSVCSGGLCCMCGLCPGKWQRLNRWTQTTSQYHNDGKTEESSGTDQNPVQHIPLKWDSWGRTQYVCTDTVQLENQCMLLFVIVHNFD